jgi:uncharacterized protein YraI
MKRIVWLSAVAAMLLAPAAAMATTGYVVEDVSLRAGPDTDFPRITVLDAGTRVSVLGCIDGWEWCDVVAYGERGWVAGRFLELAYEGRHVYLYDYGPRIGIPIISFSIGSYWGRHYRDRPWYDRRDYWAQNWGGTRSYDSSSRYSARTGRRYGDSYRDNVTAPTYVRRPALDTYSRNPPAVTQEQYGYRRQQSAPRYDRRLRSNVQSQPQVNMLPYRSRTTPVLTQPQAQVSQPQAQVAQPQPRDSRAGRGQMARQEAPGQQQRREHRGRQKDREEDKDK